MAVSESYRMFVLEQLGQVQAVSSKSMFGGVGIYADGLFFALIDDDRLYFKVDEASRSDFERHGMEPFRPFGEESAMGYYEVPADVVEDSAELAIWIQKAVEVARKAKANKAKLVKPLKRNDLTRRSALLIFLSTLISIFAVAMRGHCADATQPSLRESARGRFTIGVGISDWIPQRQADWSLLTQHFAAITPENCLKPDPVQVMEGKFNFTRPDAFVEFGVSNGLQVIGHCLVWAKDDRTPSWFFRDGTNSVTRDLLLQRMKTHIETVAGRYRGRIAMWDVVNEALDDGTNFLRPSGWTAACGDEFIAKAFEYTHAADPEALLIYNDYNNELPGKREKLIRLVRLLKEKRAPIHAVGLQGHYEIDRIPLTEIEATLVAMRELAVKVVVSELDIDVIPRGRWWADGGKHREELSKLDPYRDGCPPEILQRQADQYAQLFRMFRKHSDVIARISFWNLHDGQSWLNYFPWTRVNHPLLFDREGKPKPAFEAVVKALEGDPPEQ